MVEKINQIKIICSDKVEDVEKQTNYFIKSLPAYSNAFVVFSLTNLNKVIVSYMIDYDKDKS